MSSADQPDTDELAEYLFKCGDIIRHSVDVTEYKNYILPLFFWKIISDTYEDNYNEILEEYGDPEIASDEAFHDFVVPEEYRWEKLRQQDDHLDEFIDNAFSAIEQENKPLLNGVFRTDFAHASGLNDETLTKVVEHLSSHNLSNNQISSETLGEVYMSLIHNLADNEGRKGGGFFTPPRVSDLMVRLLAPYNSGAEIHDPTAGSGGVLIQASRFAADDPESGDPDDFRLTGQEINLETAAIARMNLFINGFTDDASIRRGDSLSNPQFTSHGELEGFDYVFADFPFSMHWDKETLKDDEHNRFSWAEGNKLPRADRGDYAFIMHVISQLNETGRAATVVPKGVLFRRHESKFRKPMLSPDGGGIPGVDHEIVEAVINLPENLFYNTSIPSALLILNKNKPANRQGRVMFVHAGDNYVENFYRQISDRNELTEEGIDHISSNFEAWRSEDRISRVVDLDEIAANDYNLKISLYIDTTEPREEINISEQVSSFRDLRTKRDELETRIEQHLEVLNYE